MMRFLAYLVRGLHLFIGITTPPPEQEKLYVLIWVAILLIFAAMSAALLYVMKYVPLQMV